MIKCTVTVILAETVARQGEDATGHIAVSGHRPPHHPDLSVGDGGSDRLSLQLWQMTGSKNRRNQNKPRSGLDGSIRRLYEHRGQLYSSEKKANQIIEPNPNTANIETKRPGAIPIDEPPIAIAKAAAKLKGTAMARRRNERRIAVIGR